MRNEIYKILIRFRDRILKYIIWRRYTIGKNFHAGIRVRLWAKNTLVIGDHFYIGRDSQIETDCIIGDYVMFGNKVGIVGKYDHQYTQLGSPTRSSSQIRDNDYNWKGLESVTIIEDDVWIGYGTIILSGVKIGKGSIIAAGSVITGNIDPFSIYAGNPAKKIRPRFESEEDLQIHLSLFDKNYKSNKQKI